VELFLLVAGKREVFPVTGGLLFYGKFLKATVHFAILRYTKGVFPAFSPSLDIFSTFDVENESN